MKKMLFALATGGLMGDPDVLDCQTDDPDFKNFISTKIFPIFIGSLFLGKQLIFGKIGYYKDFTSASSKKSRNLFID